MPAPSGPAPSGPAPSGPAPSGPAVPAAASDPVGAAAHPANADLAVTGVLAALREAENRAAYFLPARDAGDHPCLVVAGIHVYAYVTQDGVLQLSVHFDDAIDHPEVWSDHEHAIPLRLVLQSGTPVFSIDRNGEHIHHRA